MIPLVIVADEFVERVVIMLGLLDKPEQERADWIVPHDRIEQPFYLRRIPNEFPLNRWEVKFLCADTLYRFLDCPMLVFHIFN